MSDSSKESQGGREEPTRDLFGNASPDRSAPGETDASSAYRPADSAGDGRPDGYSQAPSGSESTTHSTSGFGSPAYGQPTYEQPAYDQPTYGQPTYEQPAYGQAPYDQPAYGQAPYEQPYAAGYEQQGFYDPNTYPPAVRAQPYGAYAPPRPTNVWAIVSLAASVSSFFLLVTWILGVVAGHIALSQIKRTGDQGRGLAIAGLVTGYAFGAISLLLVAVYAFMIIAIFGAASVY